MYIKATHTHTHTHPHTHTHLHTHTPHPHTHTHTHSRPELLKGVYGLGFNRPSKIQEKALPLLLADPPENLIAQSQSGTGKTAAFVLSMLSRVNPSLKHPQASSHGYLIIIYSSSLLYGFSFRWSVYRRPLTLHNRLETYSHRWPSFPLMSRWCTLSGEYEVSGLVDPLVDL